MKGFIRQFMFQDGCYGNEEIWLDLRNRMYGICLEVRRELFFFWDMSNCKKGRSKEKLKGKSFCGDGEINSYFFIMFNVYMGYVSFNGERVQFKKYKGECFSNVGMFKYIKIK